MSRTEGNASVTDISGQGSADGQIQSSAIKSSAIKSMTRKGVMMPDCSTEENRDTTPPDGGYGWVCVVACFTINGFTWGVTSSYGVYLSYYLNNYYFPGARPLDYAFIGGSMFAAAMLSAPLVTYLVRERGTHFPMIIGVGALSGGLVLASFATQTWELYLSQGTMVGIGIGFIFIPSINILSQWFLKRRSFVGGIAGAGSGVGGIIISFATDAMIENISLQWSLRVTGIMTFVMNVIAIALIRDRNKVVQPQQRPFDIKLLRRLDVWLLLVWAFISMLGYITLLYSLPDFGLSIGLTETRATHLMMYVNAGMAAGRPCIGFLSDRFGRIIVTAILTLTCGVLCFAVWLPGTTYGVTACFALLSGAILGVFWVVSQLFPRDRLQAKFNEAIGPLCAEIGGLELLPSLLSLSWLTAVLPTFFSEAISLELRRKKSERQYLYTQIFAGTCYIIASVFLFELFRRRRDNTAQQQR